VIEHDLAPSLLVFYCVMGLGEFYIFAAIFSYFVLLIGGLLVLAYKLGNAQMIKTFRFLLVLCTICAFFNVFIDDMIFADATPEKLMSYAYPGQGLEESSQP